MGTERQIDRGVMPHRGVFEAVEVPARGLVDPSVMFGQSLVEIAAPVGHDRFDRFDMAGDAVAEGARMKADPFDDGVAAVADERLQGLQLLSQLFRLFGQGAHEGAAARTQRVFERGQPRSQGLVDALAADRNRGDRLACGRSEPFAGVVGHFRPMRERFARAYVEALLGRASVGVDRVDSALGRGIDLAAERAGALVERGAQLRLPRREMLGPMVVGGIESRARVLRALGDLRGQSVGGGSDGVLEGLTAHDDRFVQPIGHIVQTRHQVFGALAERFRERAAGRLDAVEHVLAAFAEFVSDGLAGLRELAATVSPRSRIACAACALLESKRSSRPWLCSVKSRASAWLASNKRVETVSP